MELRILCHEEKADPKGRRKIDLTAGQDLWRKTYAVSPLCLKPMGMVLHDALRLLDPGSI